MSAPRDLASNEHVADLLAACTDVSIARHLLARGDAILAAENLRTDRIDNKATMLIAGAAAAVALLARGDAALPVPGKVALALLSSGMLFALGSQFAATIKAWSNDDWLLPELLDACLLDERAWAIQHVVVQHDLLESRRTSNGEKATLLNVAQLAIGAGVLAAAFSLVFGF